ncbi:MAG: mandelate racemase/muconate lactonizing enzyme family protein [Nakamurella sp.]
MSICGVETIRTSELPNLIFVLLHTTDGLVGLGETYYGSAAVEAHVHEALAPKLLGLASPDPAAVAELTTGYVGYLGTGVEMRARSALDLAVWDLTAQLQAIPLADLLGRRRTSLPIYNTCAGREYMRRPLGQRSENWGLADGQYEDLNRFPLDPEGLAQDFLASGVSAMKVWPLDTLAERLAGRTPTEQEIENALAPVRRIRDAVGDQIEIILEMHALWSPQACQVILPTLGKYHPYWVEDPIRPDHAEAMVRLRKHGGVRVASGETLGAADAYLPLLEQGAIDIAIMDVGWCGGISEALQLSAHCQDSGVPLTLHDCSGPVVLAASTQLAMHLPSAFIQETTRAYYHGWYQGLVDGLPTIEQGTISSSPLPGLGITLRPEFLHAATTLRTITGRRSTHQSDGLTPATISRF